MKKGIKEIKVLNGYEIYEKIINKKKPKNYVKFLKIFKNELIKEDWIEISNKNMYFNKNIMSCYLKEKISEIVGKEKNTEQYLKQIYQKKEIKKLELKIDIPTKKELEKTFAGKKDSIPNIYKKNRILYKKELNTIGIKTNRLFFKVDDVYTNIFFIYKLGKESDYIKFEKEEKVFPYSEIEILNIFLLKGFIPKFIYEDKILKEEYDEVIDKFKEITLEKERYLIEGNDNSTQLNEKNIIEDFFNHKNNDELFDNICLEITLNNGDVIEKCYQKGILEGHAILYKEKGEIDIIEYQYKDGIKSGEGTIRYKNGDIEKIEYSNGKIQGNSIYYYKNGDIEKREYKEGVLNGNSIIEFLNGDIEKREYKDGILQGDATLKNINGEITRFYYKDGVKKDITKIYNLMNIDKIRVNLDKYDTNILFDPNRGHWELFEKESKKDIEKIFEKNIYGRDPRLDVKRGGIVGIDFGTKSTVVVYQDDRNKTLPMRISGTTLNKEVEVTDYENPTVVEFVNIERFIKDYKEKEGRPFTRWEDITVSYAAFQSLLLGDSEQGISVLSELKQWAGTKNKKIIVKDKKGKIELFKPYIELEENDIDPIEIYSYYIGSYINNMRNGIFLEYYLSFPVNYELEIRNKILKSFEKGIKKSLPIQILNDEKLMRQFKVNNGTSEPAAYSVCALQEYKFEPEEDEKIYYGVFDFGGGTTDFDFGIWKISEDEESYDYNLEHFGAGGDRYLGGENILKELAYEVFKGNKKIFREKNIPFARPEWKEKFAGDELLIDFSQEANFNLRQLSEKLRIVWEESREKIEENSLKVTFFNKEGQQEIGINLEVDIEKLQELIKKKITKGVYNFFESMKKAFKNEDIDKLNILLAGNSCKHHFVKEIFDSEIEKRKILAEVYPPLGTKEAFEKMKEKGIEIDEDTGVKPNGKTGVAYGILETVSDGRINIIDRDKLELGNKDIKFKYYVGDERRKKMKCLFTPQSRFETYKLLCTLKSSIFNIYYTANIEAMSDDLNIEKVMRKRILLEKNHERGSKVYIKIISPSKIEYVITIDDILEKNILENGIIDLD